ncbi:MAG: hypothetical protein J5I90_17925 [Caldilineales bacterium]|nr:hypothetical protein [Caldilineales bacterium]
MTAIPAEKADMAAHGRRQSLFIAGLLLLLIPALVPLIRSGFFISYDGTFHLYRGVALANAWAQGVLHPRLFPEFGFGYGQAILNFYAPLSYWPAAMLALAGFNPVVAVELTIALGFVLAALAMYGYVNWLWGPWAGLLAAITYTYFPYHLADAYARGAVPELMAFIFPPLILWTFTAAFGISNRSRIPQESAIPFLLAALAYAALVLTHNLTALLMVPVTAVYLLLLAACTNRWRRLLPAAGALLLALGLSAFYWLPVLVESGSVGLAIGPSEGFGSHALSALRLISNSIFYAYHGESGAAETYPLNWFAVIMFISVISLLIWRWRQRRQPANTPILAFHIGLTVVAIFMTTTLSLFLWRLLAPVLGHLQFPWRFLLLAAVGLAVAVSALPVLLPRIRPSYLLAGVIFLALLTALPRLPVQNLSISAAEAWSPQRMWAEDAANGQVGATWAGEFLPLAVTAQRWEIGHSKPDAADGAALPGPIRARVTGVSYDGINLDISTPANLELRLHQFTQPGWNAAIDGTAASIYPSGDLALATITVPAGSHQISFDFGRTTARTLGALISLASAIVWGVLAWYWGRERRSLRIAAVAMLVLALIMTLNSLGVGQKNRIPKPVQAQMEDVVQLIGWEASPARGAENTLDVTLYWLARREVATDYKAFVHALDNGEQVIAQHDGDPVGGFTPTTRWQPGEIIVDTHRLVLPEGNPTSQLSLRAGMYELTGDGLRNLVIDPPTPDGRVDLGKVQAP